MSVASDLASAYQERELTVPVVSGASSTRGFLDRSAAMEAGDGSRIQRAVDVLQLIHGSIPGLEIGATVVVGALGADAVAVGDPSFVVQDLAPIGDGLEDHVFLAELGITP